MLLTVPIQTKQLVSSDWELEGWGGSPCPRREARRMVPPTMLCLLKMLHRPLLH